MLACSNMLVRLRPALTVSVPFALDFSRDDDHAAVPYTALGDDALGQALYLRSLLLRHAGTTQASRPNRRGGAEYTLHAKLLPWLTLDPDAAYTQARLLERSRRARPPQPRPPSSVRMPRAIGRKPSL